MLFTTLLLQVVLASLAFAVPQPVPLPEPGREINPNFNHKKCFDVKDGLIADNTPVQMSVAFPTPLCRHS